MRKLTLLSVFLIALAAVSLHAESADDFLKAYFLIQEGDAADKGAEGPKAVKNYSDALKILRAIKRSDPSWNPNIIAYRTKWCADHITKNGGAIEPEDTTSAPTAGTPPTTTPPPGSKEPIHTVPKGVVPDATTVPSGVSDSSTDARVQELLKENKELKQRLTEAEIKLKSAPTGSDTMSSLKEDLVKAQAELEQVKKENEQLRSSNDALKQDLEETRAKLKTASSGPAADVSPEALQTLQKENSLLRSIVDRQYQEDAKRTEARDKVAKDLEELSARTEEIKAQLAILQTPLTPLTDDEKQLLKTGPGHLRVVSEEETGKLVAALKASHGDTPPPPPKLSPENQTIADEAKKLFASGDYEGAASKYEKILVSEPRSLLALSNLGVIRFREGKTEEAEKALRGALAIDPRDAFSLSILGVVLYQQDKLDDSISSLKKAIELDPKSPEYHNFIGNAYSRKGYPDAAERELLKAIELNPNYAEAHFNLAVVYATQHPPSYELARKSYKKAVELGMSKDPEFEKLLKK